MENKLTASILVKRRPLFAALYKSRVFNSWQNLKYSNKHRSWKYGKVARLVCLTDSYDSYDLQTRTHVKTHILSTSCWLNKEQVVTSLFTSCQQDVFALLVPSCWNKLLTSCHHHSCNKLVITTLKLLQTCFNNWEQAVRRHLVDSLWTDL